MDEFSLFRLHGFSAKPPSPSSTFLTFWLNPSPLLITWFLDAPLVSTFFLCRYEALRITITQEIEHRSAYPTTLQQQQQQPKANYTNVQLVERCYPNYYQSATISEIDEPTENAQTASVVASVQNVQNPVQASPVLVLHDDHQRQQLRQKALIDSVESKV